MSQALAHRRITVLTDFMRYVGGFLRLSETTLAPVMDLIRRFFLAQVFFVSGIVKVSDWENALYLAQYEYPVSWMDPTLAAWIGAGIELICPVFLLLGLMTRFFCIPLLILSIVIQTEYQAVNAQVFWILLFGWYVILGPRALSLDYAFRGLRDTALPLARQIGALFKWKTRYLGPVYKLFIRFWIASVLYVAGHSAMELPGMLSILNYRFQVSVLSMSEASFFVGLVSNVSAIMILLGLGTRLVSLFTALALLYITAHVQATPVQASEYVYWVMLLSILFFNGPGVLSLDGIVLKWLTKTFPQLEGKVAADLSALPHVVIVGAGFGGISAARRLRTTACRVTLIDQHNYHLFQPLLYQVATAALSPADIAVPIRSMFRDQQNLRVLLGTVKGVNKNGKCVELESGKTVAYDYLILATGAQHSYFGKDQWAPFAPGLKRIEDATSIRRKLLLAFEEAENTDDPQKQKELLTFVIVGGGPTGVELAGAIAELAHHGLKDEFRNVNPAIAEILLVQAAPHLLPVMPEPLSVYTEDALKALGVTLVLNGMVSEINAEGVMVGDKRIPASNVFWAAGVQASPAAKWVAGEADRAGRLKVNKDFSVPGAEGVYAIGDTVEAMVWDGKAMPGLAPAAKQSGEYAAKKIRAIIEGRPSPEEFKYVHYGSLATIGRKAAVADFGKVRLRGPVAWWFWGAIHVLFLAGMRNRVTVMWQWFWSYLTYGRATRLITGKG